MRWSISAHRLFRRCERQYAYAQIVASSTAADPVRREAYCLKQLQTIANWQGSLVHRTLADRLPGILERGGAVDAVALTAHAEALAYRQFAFSSARRYRRETKRATGDAYCALVDHESGDPAASSRLVPALQVAERCFRYLAAQGDFLRHLAAGYRCRSELRLHFGVDEASIQAVLDLLVERGDGTLTIVDWKIAAGESGDYRQQLLLYALAVLRSGRWPTIDAAQIEIYEANLLRGTIRRHAVTAPEIGDMEDFVFRSASSMAAALGDGGFAALRLGDLAIAANPNTCAYCRFRQLCLADLAQDEARGHELVQGRLC